MLTPKTEDPLPFPGLEIAADGQLYLAGFSAHDLAAQYGTPLLVLLEDVIRTNCREYRRRIEQYPRSRVYYAAKALLTTGLARLMAEERMGLDVVSAGELSTALAADFPPELILMHGNARSEAELALALESGVGRIVVDNDSDIERLTRLTEGRRTPVSVMLRVTPGIQPDTHEYVQTGQQDSKFGFNLAGGAARAAALQINNIPSLKLVGLHCHIGSQLKDLDSFAAAIQVMLEFYAALQREGVPLDELNIGGGLGVRYRLDEAVPDIDTHVDRLAATTLEVCKQLGIQPPVLCDEPGRSIIAEAGITLYRVESVKRIEGVRNYVSVDGGMTDNPRFALYGTRHHCLLANRATESPDGLWSVAGKCCESGDMLLKDTPLPEPEVGDLLVLLTTGAYTYSMASNYNRVARPAVVLVGQGRHGLLARRETPEDLMRLDETPKWLR